MKIGNNSARIATPRITFKSVIGTNRLKPLTTVIPMADREQRDLFYTRGYYEKDLYSLDSRGTRSYRL